MAIKGSGDASCMVMFKLSVFFKRGLNILNTQYYSVIRNLQMNLREMSLKCCKEIPRYSCGSTGWLSNLKLQA